MLAPGRAQHYFDAAGTRHTILVRDHNWDWAGIPAAGAGGKSGVKSKRRQFWSVNRWPVEGDNGAGYVAEEVKRAVRGDVFADPAVGYDAAAGDVTRERRFLRPKLRKYREEKVVVRRGPAVYPVGDTRLQREVLRERMVEMVERAAGLEPEEPTWGEALMARLNPFSRPLSRTGDREEGKLPPVDPGAVPKSWDPVAEAERRAAEERPESDYETMEEDMEEGDEVESVDVPMTGMGRSWIAA
ncbi:hypothetical protein B0I37DRAFT_10484 [Chaetomium sp. MPI-CAGE-AT-0009]|nr:hypothetical protein B0I37DRAFT_10484 [Chaetomium sp. MPI-CAGE-AT-0009]